MNKIFYSGLLIASLGLCSQANAQLSLGGIPLSNKENVVNIKNNIYSLSQSWSEHKADYYANNPNGLYIVGQLENIDVKFPESGTFTYLNDGSIIWQTKITVPTAPAIGLYMDQFQLPKGVNMYVKSENGKQILGAYTNENNSPDKIFAIEACIGESITVEFNISANVNVNDIEFHADKAGVYHESIEHLKEFLTSEEIQTILNTGTDADPYNLEGRGSTCMINANCPNGDSHPLSKKATVQTLVVSGGSIGMCSATVINNTGNSAGSCTPMLFLASHCESSGNGWANTNYSNWLVRFNFQRPDCNGTAVAKQNTITGMNFKSRSDYYANMPVNQMEGDFLLLQFRQSIPERFEAAMAGWDLGTQPNTAPSGQKYIGFHHPAGDVKKVTYATSLTPSNGLHYTLVINNQGVQGGYAQGSSGSGLFREDGIVIGTASTAGNNNNPASACLLNSNRQSAQFMNVINYYRFSQGWEYDTAANKQMKVWLDPTNSGVTKLGPLTARCGDPSILSVTKINPLENNVNIYPNPSTDGYVNIQFNLEDKQDLNIEVYDLTGKRVFLNRAQNVTNNNLKINVSELSNGMYLVKVSNKAHSITKKITIAK